MEECIMAFDFTAAVNAAQAVVDRAEGNSDRQSYSYTLVYPQPGQTLIVRPLFNPASGQILRLVNRHEKVACYRTYGQECPICQIQQQVQDMTGQDPFGRGKSSRSRGVCLAQFISSTVPLEKGDGSALNPGEVILFMFPWSVYSQINTIIQAIAQTPTGMEQAFSHCNTGLFLQITVDANYKYTTTNVPYMTFQSAPSDEEFMKMLEGLENLNEQILPATITDEVAKQVEEYKDAIYRQYVLPRTTPNVGVPNVTPQNFSQQVPQTPPAQQMPSYAGMPQYQAPVQPGTVPPVPSNYSAPMTPPVGSTPVPQNFSQPTTGYPPVSTTPASVSGNPQCFGQHKDGDTKCICCPAEMTCLQNSQK